MRCVGNGRHQDRKVFGIVLPVGVKRYHVRHARLFKCRGSGKQRLTLAAVDWQMHYPDRQCGQMIRAMVGGTVIHYPDVGTVFESAPGDIGNCCAVVVEGNDHPDAGNAHGRAPSAQRCMKVL